MSPTPDEERLLPGYRGPASRFSVCSRQFCTSLADHRSPRATCRAYPRLREDSLAPVTGNDPAEKSAAAGTPTEKPQPPTGSALAPPDGEVPELTFPDLPRLELDQLLAQLIERAQEVMSTQGRLRGLLRASHVVTGDLALPVVLRRIVHAARDLVGARYAALGVISPSGGLAEFIHDGMPPEALGRIGHLPRGRGLLGALIDDPRPIRLRHLATDPRSAGFPPGHPPMDSFLGVPIRIRGEVFGNLYLAESTHPQGDFTAEDEDLLTALAGTAGVAIDNARLYEAARARGEWLQASAAITRQMLAPYADMDRSLQLIAGRTREIARADLVVVLFPDGEFPDGEDPGRLRIQVSVGADADHLPGLTLPVEGSVSGRVFTTGEPVRVPRLVDGTGLTALTSGEVELGPALAVPLTGSDRVHGVLTAARLVGRPGFMPTDLDMVGSFASHAALAIELAQARREQERAALFDDRERIAADLHDHVIQRLFAAGLSLQGVAAGLDPGRPADRVHATIRDLDATIQQIRATIFQLQQGPRAGGDGVRARLLDVLAEIAPALGFEPGLRFSGLLEGTLSAPVVEDLLAVLREALTNVARHAGAHTADVAVTVTDHRLTLRVADDGRGIGPTERRSGLANLRRRAETYGGTFTIESTDAGTVLCWSVPTAG